MSKLTKILNDFAERLEKESDGIFIRSPDKASEFDDGEAMVCMYDVDISGTPRIWTTLCLTLYYGIHGDNITISIHYTPCLRESVFEELCTRCHYTSDDSLTLRLDIRFNINKDTPMDKIVYEIADTLLKTLWKGEVTHPMGIKKWNKT